MKVRLSNLFKSKKENKKTFIEIVTEMEKLAESIQLLDRSEITSSDVHMVFLTDHRNKEAIKAKRPSMRAVVSSPERLFGMLADTSKEDKNFGNTVVMASIAAESVSDDLKKARKALEGAILNHEGNDCECTDCRIDRAKASAESGGLQKEMTDKDIEDFVNKILNDSKPDKE